jgi:hypothetical protein
MRKVASQDQNDHNFGGNMGLFLRACVSLYVIVEVLWISIILFKRTAKNTFLKT